MGNVAGNQPGSLFTEADLDHIVQSTFVQQVEFHRAIDSTNDRALELARHDVCTAPLLVLAETQTGGRGRGSNTWWAQRGALTFSLILPADALQLPPRDWPQASLTTGLAVCEAIEDFLGHAEIRLKWPNDVYLDGRKVCGILIELPPQPKRLMVIGIGINVNNSLQHAPDELQSTATALCDATHGDVALADLLQRVLVRLQERLDWIGRRDAELWTRWRARCLLTNRQVQVDAGVRQVAGRCLGIDDQGALLIETGDQTERCYAGTVTQF